MTPTLTTSDANCMPQYLRMLASNKGLETEGNCVSYSEDQGQPATATVCVERVLVFSDGGLRLHMRSLRRETLDGLWQPLCDTPYSDMLTQGEAVSLINHWGDLQQEASARRLRMPITTRSWS